ncbi:hypothetical protein [Vagococcus carniphilus]|uniref:hypothetical protein n=1 Tax=Vagococcus carniphilus TaxID=218144 RepID=UPI00288C7978|nr:hypothetical protein [Vagococcus carniphilus]MDT2866481.1 hypothetical protein [Vagococcus carniphilus]
MTDRKIKKIGFILTMTLTLIVLAACNIPTTEEQEAKKEDDRIEKKIMENRKKDAETSMFSESVSMTHFDGTSLNKVAFKDRENEALERFVLRDNQTFNFVFKMYDWNVSLQEVKDNKMILATKDMIESLDFDRLVLEDNNVGLEFVNLRDFEVNGDEATISFNADLEEDDVLGMILDINLNLKLKYGNTKVLVSKNGGDYAATSESKEMERRRRGNYEDDGRVMGQGDVTSEEKAETNSSWSGESYTEGEDTTIPINDGNIDDWDHILDDWELEEGIAEDGEGIYD